MLNINEKFEYISDAGHGWLKVKNSILKEIGLYPTQYSFFDKDYSYLEEDCDMAAFVLAWNDRTKTPIQLIEKYCETTGAAIRRKSRHSDLLSNYKDFLTLLGK